MYERIRFWTKYESNIFLFLRELFKQKISLTVYWRYSYPTFLYNICDNFVRFADLTYIYIYIYMNIRVMLVVVLCQISKD